MFNETTYTYKNTSVKKQHDFPYLTCHDNQFVYNAQSLSWMLMLSYTWADLLKCPADIIVLPYFRGLRMDRLGVGRQGQIIFVVMSIKYMECAFLYGVRKPHELTSCRH